MTLGQKIADALAIINTTLVEHAASEIWAGFSGGHDSLVIADLLSRHTRFAGTFHANTGIGVEATRQYVRDLSRLNNWGLREIHTDESYDRIVTGIGFPGAAHHRIMYARLKDRPVMELLRTRKRHRRDRIMLATGIRNSESHRRMGYAETTNKVGALIWVNPLLHWSKDDRDQYIADRGLPRNEVADALGMSGECLCGAYAKPGELARVRRVDPGVAARIDGLNGVCVPKFGWGWEEQPPRGHVTPREELSAVLTKAPLCAGCNLRHHPDEGHVIDVRQLAADEPGAAGGG
jgi:3'-phosphoadenosine 5'-phosphosulfate sulfotransferase (PAPS reductase)/FAD synthetase